MHCDISDEWYIIAEGNFLVFLFHYLCLLPLCNIFTNDRKLTSATSLWGSCSGQVCFDIYVNLFMDCTGRRFMRFMQT